jgi:two-component system alkaline phosphatase synthesis response regulator PhoP
MKAGRYELGNVQIDVRRTEVTREGQVVQLSAKEFQLLRYFLEHRGTTVSRETLLHEVWGYDSAPSTRTVDVHVAWLRQKLEDDPKNPQLIRTVVGLGYQFADR